MKSSYLYCKWIFQLFTSFLLCIVSNQALIDYQSQTVLDWMLLEIPIKAPSIMTYEVKKFLHLPVNWTKLLTFVQLRGERDNFTVSLSLLHFSLVNVFFVCKNCLFLFLVIYLAKGLLDLTPVQLILVQVEENTFVTFVKKGYSKYEQWPCADQIQFGGGSRLGGKLCSSFIKKHLNHLTINWKTLATSRKDGNVWCGSPVSQWSWEKQTHNKKTTKNFMCFFPRQV